MTPQQIDLIRSSFAQVLFRKDEAGKIFYQRLFAIAPEVRTMFKGDMVVQAQKLVETLAVAVGALRDTPALMRTLRDLGERHRGYGVAPAHYAPVGEALIWTLDRLLGPAFDATTRKAWVDLYGVVSLAMLARDARAA